MSTAVLFFSIILTNFIAEMGDKTQLMLIALTSKYTLKSIITGTAVAIMVLNALAVIAGSLVSSIIPVWIVKFIAAGAFLFFAVTSLNATDGDEEETKNSKSKFAPLAVFCTFFVAELGDKTQLTAINFAMDNGFEKAFIVWSACSIGLFAADMAGLLLGCLLKSKAPSGILNLIAFVLFSFFGFSTLPVSLSHFLGKKLLIPVMIAAGVIYAIICTIIFVKSRRKSK